MKDELPDIAKRAARVAAAIEEAVTRFARKHRYNGSGADLRNQAREVVRRIHVAWRDRITEFLRTELRLELKADQKLRPLHTGIDFLGYVGFPTHTVVRRRVIQHVRARLSAWQRRHITGRGITQNRDALDQLRSTWASYVGHFRHANSYRLRVRIFTAFPWLAWALRRKGGR